MALTLDVTELMAFLIMKRITCVTGKKKSAVKCNNYDLRNKYMRSDVTIEN